MSTELMPLAKELWTNAIDWGYFRRVDRAVGVEVPFLCRLTDDVSIKGFIDRLDLWADEADIIDLKTQKSAYNNETLHKNWQARIYNIAVRHKYPQVTGKACVSFWVLRHHVQRVWLSAADAGRDEIVLADKVTEIRAIDKPTVSPSPLCQWCPYTKKCKGKNLGIKERKRLDE